MLDHLKVSFRFMKKAKLDTAIKLTGLSFGLAVCAICSLYIMNEFNFNTYYPDTENVYRVISEYSPNAESTRMHAGSSPNIAQLLIDEFPEVETATRSNAMSATVKYKENVFNQIITAVDSTFFDIFNVEMIRGEKSSIYTKPYTILVTEEFAETIFPNEDPIGKTVSFANYFIENKEFEITGIMKTPPRNNRPIFDAITCEKKQMPDWFFDSWRLDEEYLPVSTYIKVHPDVSVKELEAKLHREIPPKMGPSGTSSIRHMLQPYNRIYLYSSVDYGFNSGGDIQTVWMFVLLTLVILTIVCINYVNLTVARFTLRNKEISIRKANGATMSDLRKTIFSDSLTLCFMAIPFALLLASFGLDLLNRFLQTDLQMNLLHNPKLILSVFVIAFLTGIISSIYPAIVYCSQTPAYLMNKDRNTGKRKNYAKQALVIFQFSVSIILIIITIVWHNQYNHYAKKDPGFNTKNMLISSILGSDPNLRLNSQKVVDVVKENPDIELSSAIHILPGTIGDEHTITPEGYDFHSYSLVVHAGDINILKMFDLKVISGRGFSETNKSDMVESCLINEAAVKDLNWDNPIGKRINWQERDMRVIGVVKDYHASPFYQKIKPTMVTVWEPIYNYIAFKVDESKYPQTKEYLEKALKTLSPDSNINLFTYDDIMESQYNSFKESSSVFAAFSMIAIFLACLGLFSLSQFSVLQRIKEVGIRKAIGARSFNIVLLFMRDLLVWVAISFCISCPIAYYISYSGIKNFENHVSISWWVFVLAGLIALSIGVLTVIFHTLRAAMRNPVKALRYE